MSAVLIWTAAEVDDGKVPAEYLPHVRQVLEWSREYLVNSNPDLGRSGPVCPYTQPSLRKGLYYLAAPTTSDVDEAIRALREQYTALSAGLSPDDQELLTILLALPHLDYTDSTELDDLQRAAKDSFVAGGLMIGQFHPVCDEPGLWNAQFKALRAPLPLLAIRKLVVFDLPFVIDTDAHAESYLSRFAPDIPTRIRDQLVKRVASPVVG
ncbi:hypothetical protein LWC34_01355 [Kibdelosporangium philippinense]|uniref:DUF6875 domain-containing protein n=1 Tax=Kibdelosporangium philippinense TaxID=211113 RepID=A0ABS8Z3I9_9PSEU|nr:hypothetical protein [Kibdelosporangium philippinense]MCE7001494.1 hypothetical protein [Kibdelosporangium philippinense]